MRMCVPQVALACAGTLTGHQRPVSEYSASTVESQPVEIRKRSGLPPTDLRHKQPTHRSRAKAERPKRPILRGRATCGIAAAHGVQSCSIARCNRAVHCAACRMQAR
jgi:hypothetical protein